MFYVTGQVPRIGSSVMATGRMGVTVRLEQAKLAAEVFALRAVAFLEQQFGLHRVDKVLRIHVFTQSAPDFTQQSNKATVAHMLAHR